MTDASAITANRPSFGAAIPSIVEEDIRDRIADAIQSSGWLLDRVDPAHRLSRIGLTSRLSGVGYAMANTRGGSSKHESYKVVSQPTAHPSS